MNPEEPRLDVPAEGISRRRVLKRIGAGAAVAWTAPILISIRTPAFAQPYGIVPCDPGQLCTPDCDVQRPCMQPKRCLCFRDVDTSACVCVREGAFCETFTPCASGADCPSNEVCVATCCPTGICMRGCGAGGSGPRQPSNMKGRLTK